MYLLEESHVAKKCPSQEMHLSSHLFPCHVLSKTPSLVEPKSPTYAMPTRRPLTLPEKHIALVGLTINSRPHSSCRHLVPLRVLIHFPGTSAFSLSETTTSQLNSSQVSCIPFSLPYSQLLHTSLSKQTQRDRHYLPSHHQIYQHL